ncbi:putative E3 ubiquitin-protein ligase UBR7 [Chionoecetes opilio]|uniref:Putative E3 ubiquitin-protein ligase UBR7 n=1 Tax=Chionoecetes opilio TaxID=41210 RepID=A0A8J5CN17_CHIOP|nr:putative E3 ubiquitin-protein ligase UBR7 [Chionoecetes opilio]
MEDNVEDEESGISMVELLQEEEERQLNAAAVLGAADDTQCTYDKGNMKRQALYACMTCSPTEGDNLLAGVCLACSYHCHEDHDLVELYTKRQVEKLPVNPENKYNHNFRGKYCTCQRPYPDPEDPNEDEMIQCCLCEDWYHGKHQGGSVPQDEMYGDMICSQCLPKHQFLAHYVGLAVTVVEEEEAKTSPVVVEEEEAKTSKVVAEEEAKTSKVVAEEEAKTSKVGNEKSPNKNTQDEVKEDKEKKVCLQSEKNPTESECKEDVNQNGAEKLKKSGCKLTSLIKHTLPEGALFLASSWRQQLCACDSCKATYKAEEVLFLLDDEDTVNFYEESGKSRQPSSSAPVERELEALSSLDRVVRTEMVHEYNNLSTSLREYLKKFAESKKVVRDEDIKEFFTQLAANKKQKPNSIPKLFCR